MRMAGRMGNQRTTVQRLRVMRVDSERHLLLLRGSVPGAKNGLLYVRRTVKPTK
jgi:large subunit ribosomal protein L3